MAKTRSVWRCRTCGGVQPRWVGRCPECGEFGTYAEEAETASPSRPPSSRSTGPIPLGSTLVAGETRASCGLPEFDRVLGGGLVAGSLVLVGGEPGIGKSTLLLQAAAGFAQRGETVLYVSAEESAGQVGARASRLGLAADGAALLAETDISCVETAALDSRPSVLVVDSLQAVTDPDLTGPAGTVTQVRGCAARLVRLAKFEGISTIVVGHVTKDGTIAGPRAVEHMVDAVLYFEGDAHHVFRVLRSVKNRFGPAGELGMFEMDSGGLRGVGQPSAALLAGRDEAVPGSAAFATIEGTRAMLVEIQALVSRSFLQAPRRLAVGLETGRLLQTIAVLERRAGCSFVGHDVFVSVAGGVRLSEPAADLPLALALASALVDTPLPPGMVSFGEVGLTGEVRPVPRTAERLREASAMGFATAIGATARHGSTSGSMTAVDRLAEALAVAGLARGGAECQPRVAQS